MFTIVHRNFLSGEACKMKLAPDEEIATPHGRITEIRWRLDFEDQSDPVIKNGTAKVIRLNDGDVAFENDPPTIRYVRCARLASGSVRGARFGAARNCRSSCAG